MPQPLPTSADISDATAIGATLLRRRRKAHRDGFDQMGERAGGIVPDMSTASVLAARLRGAMTGAVSGAAALAAHGMGGGMLPTDSTLVLLVAGCVLVGVIGAGPAGRWWPVPIAQLGAGQLLGHLVLAWTSEHTHPMALTPAMLVSHAVFAVVVGIALGIAERLARAVVSSLRWWLVLLTRHAETVADQRCLAVPGRNSPTPARLLLSSGLGNRGPPVTAAAL
ncbi:hypothetical protein OG225_36155 [Nocardia sp. NBC_01377]|uniref:hypothetical protein n=1 Tax=Nocardia sp. NBC_01377 TaxID=2903595 RepID=UPI00324DA5CB